MKIIKTFEIDEIPNPHFISVRALLASENAQFEHLILEPNQEQKRHVAFTSVFLYVLEGQGMLEASDMNIQITADMLVELPSETPHRLVNNSSGRLRILNVKAPRPKKATHLVADKGPTT